MHKRCPCSSTSPAFFFITVPLTTPPFSPLFLTAFSSIMSVRNRIALEKANITHVLTVLQMERPEKDLFASFKDHLVIGVHDVDDENLLEHFASTNAFIQSGLDQGGGVLVHWLVSPFLSVSSF